MGGKEQKQSGWHKGVQRVFGAIPGHDGGDKCWLRTALENA
jgi:hypothetical protein